MVHIKTILLLSTTFHSYAPNFFFFFFFAEPNLQVYYLDLFT